MSDLPWPSSKVLTDEEFFNRMREMSDLSKLLESTGENNSLDILVAGIKGVGKTVLLNRIKQSMDENYLVVYMDFTHYQSYQLNKTSMGLLGFYHEKIFRNFPILIFKIDLGIFAI